MGPWHNGFYEKHNIPFTEETVTSSLTGNVVTRKTYDPMYWGGRVDIDCDEPWQEIGMPLMEAKDWRALQDWCDDFETKERLGFNKFIAEFEKHIGRKVKWFDDSIYSKKEKKNDI